MPFANTERFEVSIMKFASFYLPLFTCVLGKVYCLVADVRYCLMVIGLIFCSWFYRHNLVFGSFILSDEVARHSAAHFPHSNIDRISLFFISKCIMT